MVRLKQERPQKRLLHLIDAKHERSEGAPASRARKTPSVKRRRTSAAACGDQASSAKVPLSDSSSLTEIAELVFAGEKSFVQLLQAPSSSIELHLRTEQSAELLAAAASEVQAAVQLDDPCLLYIGCSAGTTKPPVDLVSPMSFIPPFAPPYAPASVPP
jgi:hypothetical protein